jgi:hypothetical protein
VVDVVANHQPRRVALVVTQRAVRDPRGAAPRLSPIGDSVPMLPDSRGLGGVERRVNSTGFSQPAALLTGALTRGGRFTSTTPRIKISDRRIEIHDRFVVGFSVSVGHRSLRSLRACGLLVTSMAELLR